MPSPDKHHRINYLEFNVRDLERTKAFFGSAFGFTFTDYGPEYAGFSDGEFSGGFAKSGQVASAGGGLVILYSTSLEATREGVKGAGGTIVKDIFDFPGGRRFHFADPDGHEWAVWSDAVLAR